jgi:hypothetical protein
MKAEIPCSGTACLLDAVTYDSDNPETLAPHVVCSECRERAETNELRLRLITQIADGFIEDRDLEQMARLVDHLFGTNRDPKLTAAGFYSLTPRQRKKIRRRMDEEFGPQIPEPI